MRSTLSTAYSLTVHSHSRVSRFTVLISSLFLLKLACADISHNKHKHAINHHHSSIIIIMKISSCSLLLAATALFSDPVNAQSPPAPPSNLAELCATDTISSDLVAYLECSNVCLAATCCGDTCSTDLTACIPYVPCAVLADVDAPEPTSSSPVPAPPANLVTLCDADTIASDFDSYIGCLTSCIPASCCDTTCSTDTMCFSYLPCANLDAIDEPPFENGVTIPPTVATPTAAPVTPGAATDSGAIDTSFRLGLSLLFMLVGLYGLL